MPANWNSIQKLLFLFIGIYLFFYTDILGWVFGFSFETILWDKIIPPFVDYYLFCFLLLVSLLSAVVIFVLDRKRENYDQPLKWLMILVRYYLFMVMLKYGLQKILAVQFPTPSGLDDTYGESHPMTLLWVFIGYAKPYQIFGGLLELVGGLLLLSRKTVKLGTFICLGVMTNVMLLNYCYNVPVKLFSTHLVFMCLLLILFYRKDFVSFFFKNDTVNPIEVKDVVPQKWNDVKFYAKWIALIIIISFNTHQQYNIYQIVNAKKQNIIGEYKVDQFQIFSKNEPPTVVNDSLRWEVLKIAYANGYIQYPNSYQWFLLSIDENEKTFTFKYDGKKQQLKYDIDRKNNLKLKGTFEDNFINATLSPQQSEYLLLRESFRWVQERPRDID